MTRTRVVIQSRLNSSRLPGKALLTVAGMPLIELVARRASRDGHEVVVATSEESYDSRIADHLARVGIAVVRGSLDDVLGRFVQATTDLDDDDRVVRLTGDNPVGDATLIDELAEAMTSGGFSYGRNDVARMPEGLGCEVFSVSDLRRAAAQTDDPYDREHVTPWLRRHRPTLDHVPRDNPGDPHRYRCTVDVLSDYDRVCRMFARVDDPIGTPWQHLVGLLDDPAFTAGPSVPVRDASELGLSVVAVGGTQLTGVDAPGAVEVRAMLATAVRRGVNHVELGRDDAGAEATVRAGVEPQLTRRLQVVSRLAAVRGSSPESAALSVEASMERTFAELARRSVGSALFSSLADGRAGSGAAWQRLVDYRQEGVVRRLGVRIETPSEVEAALALPHLGHLEVPLSIVDDRFTDLGERLAGQDVLVTTYGTFAGGDLLRADHPLAPELASLTKRFERQDIADLALAYVLSHDFVTSVALGARTVDQVEHNVELATRPPLTPEQRDQARATLDRAH